MKTKSKPLNLNDIISSLLAICEEKGLHFKLEVIEHGTDPANGLLFSDDLTQFWKDK